MRPEALLRHLEVNRESIVIDADTHGTDTRRYPARSAAYYHGRPLSAEELLAEMDGARVDLANVWQNPAATVYPGEPEANAEALLEANRYLFHQAQRNPLRFLASGWTDPKACGVAKACRIAEICVKEFGFLLVKMNPAQNQFPIDSPQVLEVVDCIVSLGAIPAFHYGADTPFTPAAGLAKLAERYPDSPIVAVHMGGGGAGYVEAEEQYQQSIALGLRFPNIKYIFSALRDNYIEEALVQYQAAGAAFKHNLFCGSDAPYGRMSWNFGGFRAMLDALRQHPAGFDEASIRGYLGGNFAKFVLDGYARWSQR
jgi:predicted TIM-barrel fold metal-dependent hydrolase